MAWANEMGKMWHEALMRAERMAAGLRELYSKLPAGEHLGIVTRLMGDWHPAPETEMTREPLCSACKDSGIVAGRSEYEAEPCKECGR